MKDHVLVVNRVEQGGPVDPDGATVYGPATKEAIVRHLASIRANRSTLDWVWFDNDTPGIRYAVLKLLPLQVPELTPMR